MCRGTTSLGFDYWKGFECNHDYNESTYFFNDDPTEREWEGYDAFAQSRDAAAYIQDHAGDDEPFLLMLSWGPPHFPLHTAPEEYRAAYENREIVLRPNVPEALREQAQEELRGYYAHIAALDDAFAIVSDAIDAAGIAENTIFIFAADHGDMRQSQGLDTKLFPWDESVCVPFLLRWPQLAETQGQEITRAHRRPGCDAHAAGPLRSADSGERRRAGIGRPSSAVKRFPPARRQPSSTCPPSSPSCSTTA